MDLPTFDEVQVREALLNAVAHRDYRLGGPVFVRQFAQRLEVVSPGGLPPGITPANVLDQQSPRNRRLAEALARCGLIERSGQGMNLMFERAIRQDKPLPDFTGTSAHEVRPCRRRTPSASKMALAGSPGLGQRIATSAIQFQTGEPSFKITPKTL